MEGRSSERLSSSSEDDSPCFERASFSTNEDTSFGKGGQKRRHDDSGLDEEAFERPSKKITLEDSFGQAEKVHRMMAKMGYKEGKGLGKDGQGRLEPIEASNQKGRRGLGHYNEKLKRANLQWDPDEESITVREEVEWLADARGPPSRRDLDKWMGIGARRENLEEETLYCDAEIVRRVVESKSVFDNLDKNEMRRARTRSNPFETIRGAIFLNRAAVKMANMDRACDFMFTEPKTLEDKELLYFADVCAGPGGFSEYVLWKKKWRAKGFGFTLKESNDFKLEDFHAGTPETFYPYYGPSDDGDVYVPENQEAFRKLIMGQTDGRGVHFMMADGGFSVEGQETIQEILSKQLYLCQCLVALMIVRDGGNFVTKVFDLFTPFSAGLVYIMHRCFRRVSVFKPNTSRPANSERYLICEGKYSNVEDVIAYLSRANRVLLKGEKNRDVMQLVPHEIIEEDEQFFEYLKNSNETLGRKQIVGLLKIAAFCEDLTLVEKRQAEIRKECLEYWGLPDEIRTIPRESPPDERLKSIMTSSTMKFMNTEPAKLTTSNVESTVLNTPYDWFCMLCASDLSNSTEGSATFYLGMGRTKTFRYEQGVWRRVLDLELPPDTLVYAESISELRGEYRQLMKFHALHILDAYFLGGEDVSKLYIEERHELTKLFAEALWKPMDGKRVLVRAKELHHLTNNLEKKLRFEKRGMKNGQQVLAHVPSSDSTRHEDDLPYYIVPTNVLFLKGPALNWSRHLSKTSGCTYWFNSKTNKTVYDAKKPPSANASFPESFEKRVIWKWPADPALTLEILFSMIRSRRQPPSEKTDIKKRTNV